MKRNRKPLLKWRLVKDEWRAGPFNIVDRIGVLHNYCVTYLNGVHLADGDDVGEAMRACERLARKIIAATKKGRKHGK